MDTIYNQDYSNRYELYYLYPWMKKHELNIRNIKKISSSLKTNRINWLDLFCGQAWHFSRFGDSYNKVGLDKSEFQLSFAHKRNPDAYFIQEDILGVSLNPSSFDLITCFWAGYCYLNCKKKIKRLLEKTVNWTRNNGTIYFEVLLPRDLMSFNSSEYALKNNFIVKPRNKDYSKWTYSDFGGTHKMTSPTLEFFIDILSSSFNIITSDHDNGFMVHLIASEKLP